jgi:RNA polymerase sigma-70 factor (ECF subfamily)
MKQLSDHNAMVAVVGGNLAAIGTIYENRRRALFRFFFRLTGRQNASEDLVHEVFLRMIRYRHTYELRPRAGDESADTFESWMYRIARNAFADQSRRKSREAPAVEGEMEAVPSAHMSPFEAVARQQDLSLLYRALRALTEEQRELIVLARFEGLSYREIGQVLGCEATAVKGRVFRAMKDLSQIHSELLKEKAS